MLAAALGCWLAVQPAAAAPQPGRYQENDGRGFWSIMPPGQNQLDTALDVALFQANGTRPAHNDDQLRMYADLVYATPGLQRGDLERYFKDASFGVKPGNVTRTYSPGGRDDVTVQRDRFGVPHVYGSTRPGLKFGLGYVHAEDRLFMIDILRHLGRAEGAPFVGGSGRHYDEQIWSKAPYTEAEYTHIFDRLDDLSGPHGAQVQEDVRNFFAGMNRYVAEARLDPTKMPVEYQALGYANGPDLFEPPDIIPIAIPILAIQGVGGGNELKSALVLQAARSRFGRRKGTRVWRDLRELDDPEAPTTVLKKRFRNQVPAKRGVKGSVALPDPGSVKEISAARGGPPSSSTAVRGSLAPSLRFDHAFSNALLVSARESESGRPLMVAGPQTGYFTAQPLIEVDAHGPGMEASGIAFIGTPFVALGRGRDYAWSATSSNDDSVDTFALELCEPGGRKPTINSMHYLFRGACRPIDVLEKRISWTSNLVDPTPSGNEVLHAERTALGIGAARATIKGKPVIYTRLRSTYGHDIQQAALMVDALNDPTRIRNARDFQRLAYDRMHYGFNMFYAHDRDISYMNGGQIPVRAKGVNHDLPVRGLKRFEWRRYDPDARTLARSPRRLQPQVVNQRYITSWNNKPAHGFPSADNIWSFGSVYRSRTIEDRIKSRIKGRSKMSLTELIDSMEDAGTVDVRGAYVLPWMLRVLGRPQGAAEQAAIGKLRAWIGEGAHRRDKNRDGVYDQSEAVRIMDAWWPLWVRAQLAGPLGPQLWNLLVGADRKGGDPIDPAMIDNGEDNNPNRGEGHDPHNGSAYQGSLYGHVQKDLRSVLGRKVRGRYSRIYCGSGGRRRTRRQKLRRCRRLARETLGQALRADPKKLYEDKACASQPGIGPPDPGRKPNDQWCFDSVIPQATTALYQPAFHWINRPTWQIVAEIQSHRPR